MSIVKLNREVLQWVKDQLMQRGQFRLRGKKALVQGFEVPEVVVIDVTQSPIERPQRRQRAFYSGKKKGHTLKSQLVIDLQSGQFLCTFCGKVRRQDFKLYRASGVGFDIRRKADMTEATKVLRSYIAMLKCRTKNREADNSPQKSAFRALARRRVRIEMVNRCLKIFRILTRYRNRRRRCNLIAALYNYEQAQAATL